MAQRDREKERPQVGHRKQRVSKYKSAALVEVETNCNSCPQGHALPHNTNNGQCTPLFCAEPKKKGPKPKGMVYGMEGTRAYGDGRVSPEKERKDLRAAEKRRLGYANDRRTVRMEYIKVPPGMSGAEAEAYVTKRLVELTPYAVAELEYQLMLGDDRQRSEMAKEVLDRAGFGAKESGGAATGPILIINASGGRLDVPWAQRAPGAQVVTTTPISTTEVQALPAKDEKK